MENRIASTDIFCSRRIKNLVHWGGCDFGVHSRWYYSIYWEIWHCSVQHKHCIICRHSLQKYTFWLRKRNGQNITQMTRFTGREFKLESHAWLPSPELRSSDGMHASNVPPSNLKVSTDYKTCRITCTSNIVLHPY